MPEVCVVHLVWAPLGRDPVERFVASYRQHSAGLAHRLIAVLNGFARPEDATVQFAALGDLDHEIVVVSPPALDLPSYARAAEALDASHLCFLNSYSELLAPGWLAALYETLSLPGVGLVGATGSYEAPRSVNPLRRRRWPRFPNPHVRTTAFMLSRDLMRLLHWPDVDTKSRAWELESGRAGVTAQVRDRGLRALVVGRSGESYLPPEWPASATFRSGNQTNLLVADNRTRDWERADPDVRARLSRLAWGADPGASAARVRRALAAASPPAGPPKARA
jgi:hypothetical protein